MSRHHVCLAILVWVLGLTVSCTTGKTHNGPDKPSDPVTPPAQQTALLQLQGRCDPATKQALIDIAWPQKELKGDIRVEMTVYPKGFEKGFYSAYRVGVDKELQLDERSDKNTTLHEMGLLTPAVRPMSERSLTQASAASLIQSFVTLQGVSAGMNYQVRLVLDEKILATETIQAPICLQGKLKE